MFDVAGNTAPLHIQNMFVKLDEIHSYNTRSRSAKRLFCKFSRLEIQKRSFSRVGVNLWNKIPEHLRNSTKHSFKKEFKDTLFRNLNLDGYFVEISKLTFN